MKTPQQEVDAWNAAHPVGTRVEYRELRDYADTTKRTETITPAQVLSGHTAVVWLEGHAGCVRLSHCEPIDEEAS